MKLITGATGRIGNVLVKELNKRGEKVKVLVRKESNLQSLEGCNVEIVYGDVTDLDSLNKAFRGVDYIFHLAGLINISDYNEKKTLETNVTGTRNVLIACKNNNVKRLIYTSSIHAFSVASETDVITEKTQLCQHENRGIYDRSKARATCEVLNFVKNNGLDAVIVCPTGVIGPYDYRPSFFGQAMISLVKSGLKSTISGVYDYVDVRDVVNGILLAFEKGKKGEIYILSGEKLTMDEYIKHLKEFTGIKTKTKFINLSFAMFFAKIKSFFDRKSEITPYSISTLHSNSNISHEKASRELGYAPRSVKESLKDQYEWFKKEGMI